MSFRLVRKSVTLSDLERRNGPYFALFHQIWLTCVPTPITASSSIELTDQKSASITHRTVKLVCVTKFTHSRVDTVTRICWYRLTLLTFNLASKFHFTTMCHDVLLFGFRL